VPAAGGPEFNENGRFLESCRASRRFLSSQNEIAVSERDAGIECAALVAKQGVGRYFRLKRRLLKPDGKAGLQKQS